MKRINNKILIIAFIALALILTLTKLFLSPARNKNFDITAFQIDTARVTEIKLRSRDDSMVETTLARSVNQWTASHKDIKAPVPNDKIKNLLTVLKEIKPERVVSRKKEKWGEYELNDSTSTVVSIFEKETRLLALHVGKTSGTTTFVRISGNDEVYAIDGDLQSSFNKPFNDWRNQTLIRLDKNSINKIEFHYPADSSFNLEKKNKRWMINDKPADSVKVDAYLSKMSYQDFDSFVDHFSPATEPDVTLTFKTNTNQEFYVKGWKQALQWILNSTAQPHVYFLDSNASKTKDLYPGRKQF